MELRKSMSLDEYEGSKEEISNSAGKGATTHVPRTETLRAKITEYVDVTDEIAMGRRGMHAAIRKIGRVARFPKVRDLEMLAEVRCAQDIAFVRREMDRHEGGTSEQMRLYCPEAKSSSRDWLSSKPKVLYVRKLMQMGTDRQGTMKGEWSSVS